MHTQTISNKRYMKLMQPELHSAGACVFFWGGESK